MSMLDIANRVLYEQARERDRRLYLVDAARKWRDDLLAGRDDVRSFSAFILRKNEVERARAKDKATDSPSNPTEKT